MEQKYEIGKHSVSTILSWINSNDVVVPDIQRPFVWKAKQVRDLIDSLYRGYPVGYSIVSRSHDMKLKDGSLSKGQRILIDGQQRVSALMTAVLGLPILDNKYKEKVIKIAYNPFAKGDENIFEVQDQSHLKSKKWIEDISIFFKQNFDIFTFIEKYCADNPEITKLDFHNKLQDIKNITSREIGIIELASELDIDTVTEIFIRINSKGESLSQADFVMSKIAADEKYGGNKLRKAIDYFCHIAIDPSFYNKIKNSDKDFFDNDLGKAMLWLKDYDFSIYIPSYEDMLRVSFIHMFSRGKLKDLVSLLSGRDFDTRDYKEEIAEDSFNKLTVGIQHFMHKYYFEQFALAIKGTGFISKKLISSQNALDFAYVVYLTLVYSNELEKTEIKRYVAKWFVMSILTGRYSASTESKMDNDIKNIKERGVVQCLQEIENAEMSNAFWEFSLPQRLETPNSASPILSAYFAAQIVNGDKGLFSSTSTVRDLFGSSDVHHIFPKSYLRKNSALDNRAIYNQVANYAYLDTPTNVIIGEKAPNIYFREAFESAKNTNMVFGYPMTTQELEENLKQNCIPLDIINWDSSKFLNDFLPARRKLMAKKIEEYYKKL